jgi:hypothetical protein
MGYRLIADRGRRLRDSLPDTSAKIFPSFLDHLFNKCRSVVRDIGSERFEETVGSLGLSEQLRGDDRGYLGYHAYCTRRHRRSFFPKQLKNARPQSSFDFIPSVQLDSVTRAREFSGIRHRNSPFVTRPVHSLPDS